MPSIYSVFSAAASAIEKAPWRLRVASGVVGGVVAEGMFGSREDDLGTRIKKGIFLGAGAGLLAPHITRIVGRGANFTGNRMLDYAGYRYGKFNKYKDTLGKFGAARKALFTVPIMAAAGAGIGAAVAPDGQRTRGAMLGAGIGMLAKPASMLWSGWEKAGEVPGLQTAGIALAGASLAGAGAFMQMEPQATVAAGNTPAGPEYGPAGNSMNDRMAAINASGDIIFGLHGRRHS